MQLAFILTMPRNNCWNGQWSGDGQLHAVVEEVPDDTATRVLDKGPCYGYDFGDGWYAQIEVRQVDADEIARILTESQGFYGYQWMIRSIIDCGVILRDDQVEAFLKVRHAPETTP